ncbi:MAG TPA: SusD/RagB family nutrient-binding outer membrane lipoprotein [Puia sp.]|nr:SusD/RagB family nutrient-binding outer membrane lipoprotein [Puia sp.]
MKYSKYIFFCLLSGVFALSSCTKNFQELNQTHDKPSTTTIGPLMNNIISTLFLRGQEQASVHNDYYYPVTQLAATSSVSGYVLSNGVNDIWNDYYSTLQNMNLIQDKINAVADKESMNNVQAVLYTLRAYKTFRVTDQFGDIPYFKAGMVYTGNSADFRPAYDSQQAIYDSLLADLTWAVKNIKTDNSATTSAGNPYVSLGTFDTFLGSNMTMWLKFANSLRLRYAMQMVEKDPTTATPVIQDALANPLIDAGNDVCMWPKALGGFDLWVRWWSLSSGGAGFVRMSSTMWNLVSDNNTTAGIFDPRALLFVETNQAGQWAPFTIGVSTGDAINAYGGDPASSTDPTAKNNCIYSLLNWYLIRDEWYIPELIMTEAEVHFLKAEAYARGLGVSQDLATAETEYQAGITSSVNFWYNIAANTDDVTENWSAAAPPVPTQTQMDNLFANPKVKFTGAADDAVTKIYAQEWLSFFRQPWLAFNLWRRTGNTPVDPNSNPSSTYATFYRLPYAQDEAVNNADNYNAQVNKMGGNNSNIKVWWMK